ncbi:DNA glycosylase [Aspergillus caelatus]|uniref:DNA glycosylase n=1 Tax=Aspergillus caelatus TaxID=61420 RepID=A0A5N7AGX6_9EURO|nr:DNA glycosylase [Aspergillus caelatus]KAE8369121.1 DNA glycosylase [Aspergillus caelatus]
MERRITRSAAAKEATSLAAAIKMSEQEFATKPLSLENESPGQQSSSLGNNSKTRSTFKRRKTKRPASEVNAVNELPHNLGSSVKPKYKTSALSSGVKVEVIDTISNELKRTVEKATTTPRSVSTGKSKKANPYRLTPGITPFPDWPHPTPDACEEVNRLLSSVHGEIAPPTTIPEPSLTVTGCGEVPSVLDALIRTLLSGATSGNNSALAFNGLVQKFGILHEGIGKGSVNWDAVRQAPLKDVFEAIKRGGLADIKSKNLKAILDMVHTENQERREILVRGEDAGPSDLMPKSENSKQYEIACADQHFLSLNHLHTLNTEQVMEELVKYPGIGPKTAACVLLFCLQRPCFAVDTHIFRICKWLGWVPPDKATEITAFGHLEVRIPNHLKYSLHQLFIRHGKTCPRCRAITGQSSAGWDEGCVIDHLVKRTGKRKGEPATSPPVKRKSTGRQHRSEKA